jgi:hypothetical protein
MPIKKTHRIILLGVLFLSLVLIVIWGTYNPLRGIQVTEATYGENCNATSGNITVTVGRTCNGRRDCAFEVNPSVLGLDPAPKCEKDMRIGFVCSPSPERRVVEDGPGVGNNHTIYKISCAVQ